MKPSDRARWDIHKTYVCHPIGVRTGGFPLEGRRSREYVVVIWKGPQRAATFSLYSNYRIKPRDTGIARVPVQLRLL